MEISNVALNRAWLTFCEKRSTPEAFKEVVQELLANANKANEFAATTAAKLFPELKVDQPTPCFITAMTVALQDERKATASEGAMLDWVLNHKSHRVQGSDRVGWSVLDCRNGLTFVVQGAPTAREAIAKALPLVREVE